MSEDLASLRCIYLGSFFLDPDDIKKLGVWGIGVSVTQQGSFNVAQNAGHKGPGLGPRCIGSEKGSNPYISFYSILFYG